MAPSKDQAYPTASGAAAESSPFFRPSTIAALLGVVFLTIALIIPALRPKEPRSRRLVKVLLFWRKEEFKREPFTVADVTRAIEEVRAREQASQASLAGGYMRSFVMQVPEIVVHSCDTSPSPAYHSRLSSPASAASESSPRTPASAFSPRPHIGSSFWDEPAAARPAKISNPAGPFGKRLSFGEQDPASSGNSFGLGLLASRESEMAKDADMDEAALGSPFSPASSMVDLVSVLESLASDDDLARSAWVGTCEERFSTAVEDAARSSVTLA
ncbi:hypothetical protein C8Q80DRAFT_1125320 [Daedaleopsis nitida]|nr:hypothetical protein C8Q80DRAFT_1125320 [Daedaleopsis nitida]